MHCAIRRKTEEKYALRHIKIYMRKFSVAFRENAKISRNVWKSVVYFVLIHQLGLRINSFLKMSLVFSKLSFNEFSQIFHSNFAFVLSFFKFFAKMRKWSDWSRKMRNFGQTIFPLRWKPLFVHTAHLSIGLF